MQDGQCSGSEAIIHELVLSSLFCVSPPPTFVSLCMPSLPHEKQEITPFPHGHFYTSITVTSEAYQTIYFSNSLVQQKRFSQMKSQTQSKHKYVKIGTRFAHTGLAPFPLHTTKASGTGHMLHTAPWAQFSLALDSLYCMQHPEYWVQFQCHMQRKPQSGTTACYMLS